MVETTENFLRIEAIFHEAFAAPSEEIAELVESRCNEIGRASCRERV